MEQTLEWNTRLYMVFVDFEKAFDSLDQDMLWKILRHYGVPKKIVRESQVFHKQEFCMGRYDRVVRHEDRGL